MPGINHKPHFAVTTLGLLSCLIGALSGCKSDVPRSPKPYLVHQDDIILLASSEATAKDAVAAFELGDVEPTKRQAIECVKGDMTISANTSGVDLASSLWRLKGMGYTCMVAAF